MDRYTYDHGGIIRGSRDERRLALIFTGGSFAEGSEMILAALAARHLPGSFFVTGEFLHTPENRQYIERIVADRHYLGPHSDTHPLYCAWEDRSKTLIGRSEFVDDLKRNLAELEQFGPSHVQMRYWIPPYEWYNDEIAGWSLELGMVLFNYTPGTRSNADWAPDAHRAFLPSERIMQSILDYEAREPDGLNGFLLLLHLGAGPERSDKMHVLIPALLDRLLERGYGFVRVDELLKGAEGDAFD